MKVGNAGSIGLVIGKEIVESRLTSTIKLT